MFLGPPGVGKTSLLHALMNKPLPEANSTIVADTKHIKPQWVDANGHMHWREITEDDDITELATLVKKALPQIKDSSGSCHEYKEAVEKAKNLFAPTTETSISCQLNEETRREAQCTLSSVMKEILVRVKALDIRDRTSDDLLHIWDCGGQPIFLDIIPAFLTSRTMFYLLFDASKDINRNVEVVWNFEGQERTEGTMEMTTLDLLLQWMAMIDSSISKQESEIPDYPRVTIVGSHADQLQGDARQKIVNEIEHTLIDKKFQDILIDTVCVNNKTAGMGTKEDHAITEIRKKCKEFVSKLEVDTPLSWILFRKILKQISGQKPVISYSMAAAVAEACNIPLKALPSVLNFYHELGVFLFYSCVPGLNQKVVISPEWLIRQIGKLVYPSDDEVKSQPPRLRKQLKEEGVLDEQLLQKTRENCMELLPQEIINLLQFFLLAFPMWKDHDSQRRQYFVPLLLPRKPVIDNNRSYNQMSAPLYIIFQTNYTPPGFFIRLIASLGKNSKVLVDLKKHLYRNSITLFFGNSSIGKIDKITVSESLKSITVSVVRQVETKKFSFSNSVKEIYSIVVDSIKEVNQWFPFVITQLGFLCNKRNCKSFSTHYIVIEPDYVSSSVALCQRNMPHLFSKAEQQWIPDPPLHFQLTDDHLLQCSRLMMEGNLSILAHKLEIADEVMSSIRSTHKTTQGQAAEMLMICKEKESSMTTNELSDILKSCYFREASTYLGMVASVEVFSQEERKSYEDLVDVSSIKENTSLKEQASTLKQDNASLKEENSALKEELSSLKEDNTSLKEEKTSLKEECTYLRKELSIAKESVSHLSREMEKEAKEHIRKRQELLRQLQRYKKLLSTSTHSTSPQAASTFCTSPHAAFQQASTSPVRTSPLQDTLEQGLLDTRPTVEEILQTPSPSSNILHQIGDKHWELCAYLLHDKNGSRAKAITEQHRGNAYTISREIMSEWLRGSGRQPVSWRTLDGVLRIMQLRELADDIRIARHFI